MNQTDCPAETEQGRKMKAAVIQSANHIQLEALPLPSIKSGEALIKVKYCGICGTDIHVLHGEHPTATFPVVPGHEFVGELVDYKGETVLKRGMTVAAQPVYACGNCEPCAKGQDNVCESLRIHGCHVNGGFAEYVTAPLHKLYEIPDGVDLELAALAEPLAVAVHDVRRSGLAVGNSALVIGGGPIGLLIAIVARQAGAGKLVVSEISEYRRKIAEELGFETINPLDAEFDSALAGHTNSKGFDVVYEVSGSKAGIVTAVDCAKITGSVMIIGMTGEPYPVSLSKIFQKELSLQGVRVHAQINFIGAVDLIKSGVIHDELRKIVSAVYPLDQVEDAFDFAQSDGNFFKILVKTN